MAERVDVHLGRRLRARRRALGLTQDDVGRALDVRFQQIQKYEAGLSRMSAACLWRLSTLLDVNIRYFFEGLPEISETSQRRPLSQDGGSHAR